MRNRTMVTVVVAAIAAWTVSLQAADEAKPASKPTTSGASTGPAAQVFTGQVKAVGQTAVKWAAMVVDGKTYILKAAEGADAASGTIALIAGSEATGEYTVVGEKVEGRPPTIVVKTITKK